MTDRITLTDDRIDIHPDGVPWFRSFQDGEAFEAMREWLMAHNIDPRDVTLPTYVIRNSDGSVTYEAYVRDEEGRMIRDPNGTDALREERTSDPLYRTSCDPWPAALRELVRTIDGLDEMGPL